MIESMKKKEWECLQIPTVEEAAIAIIREALKESGCDGNLCGHTWHEKAWRLLTDIDEAEALAKAFDKGANKHRK